MFDFQKQPVRVAILDLYDGFPNQGMRGFQEILTRYRKAHGIDLSYEIFDVRKGNVVPGTDFDIYISSGGPGSPIDSEGSDWENNYFRLIEDLEAHNSSEAPNKKHVFFVCHSFQLMCRRYRLGDVVLRKSPSFGIYPMHKTDGAANDYVLAGLPDPFYAVDSRSWQVINPDQSRFSAIGATLLGLEKVRPHVTLQRGMMAIRFNEYFFGTQFHPEADPVGMTAYMLTEEKKMEVINEHGAAKYEEMMAGLNDPDKIKLTQSLIIPNFLDQAILTLQEA